MRESLKEREKRDRSYFRLLYFLLHIIAFEHNDSYIAEMQSEFHTRNNIYDRVVFVIPTPVT